METSLRGCSRCGAPRPETEGASGCPRCLAMVAFAELDSETTFSGASIPSGMPMPFTTLGPYTLIEEIARGGMGVVYRARHSTLRRDVALKVILAGPYAGRDLIARFKTEAEAAARLRHTHIVAVHDFGEVGGHHWLSMDFVLGASLATMTREGPLRPRLAARYVAKIAAAVEHAHQCGVIHRDLKPGNVIIDGDDEPRVTDFGLAKQLDRSDSPTLSGQALGTPGFAAPEQLFPRRGAVDARSDVYGLGALLYHLLTGRPPFLADSLSETIHQVENSDPVSPRLLNPVVHRDLETICLKCLAKEPHRRYAAARLVGEELDRWLRGEPIMARPAGWVEIGWRWCRRRPAVAALLGISLLLFMGGATGTLWQMQRARAAAWEATEARKLAEAGRYALDMNLAHYALNEGDLGRAGELAAQHSAEPSWERRHLARRTRSDELATLGQHESTVRLVEFAPDDRRLITLDLRSLKSWDVPNRRQTASIPWSFPNLPSLAFSPDGDVVAVAREEQGRGSVVFLDPETLRPKGMDLPMKGEIRALAFLVGGRLRVAMIGELVDVEVPGGQIVRRQELPAGLPGTYYIARTLSPDNKRLFLRRRVGTTDLGLVWDIREGQVVQTFSAPGKLVNMAWNENSSGIAGVCELFGMNHWDMKDGSPRWESVGQTEDIAALAYDSKHRRVLSGGSDQRISARRFIDGSLEFALQGHSKRIFCLAVSHDGSILASGSSDYTVRLWPNVSPGLGDTELTYTNSGDGIAISANRRWLARLGKGQLTMHPLPALAESWSMPMLVQRPWTLAVSGDGSRVMVGTEEGWLEAWNRETQIVEFRQRISDLKVLQVCFSPDDRSLAALGHDGRLRIYRASDYSLIREWRIGEQMNDNFLGRCEYSPDGKVIATIGHDSVVQLWNVQDGSLVRQLVGMSDEPKDLTFAMEAPFVATADKSGRLWVWNYITGQRIWNTEVRGATIWSLALSPAGDRLLARIDGGLVRVYDIAARREVGFLKGDQSMGMTAKIRFIDSDQVLCGGERQIKLWRADAAIGHSL